MRVFDASGRHVGSFGRQGEGPGEFQSVVGVWEYRGDSLAAFDQRLHRTTISERVTGQARTVLNPVEGNFMLFGFPRDGPLLLYNPGQFRRDLQQGRQWDSTDVVALSLDGASSRIVARLPSRELLIGPSGRELLTPFGVAIQAVGEDGFYWATSDRYEITFYDARGQPRRILRRLIQPEPVDVSMIAEYKAGYLAWVRRFEGEASVPRYERRFEEGAFGERVPLFGVAFVDGDQRLWVSESSWPVFQGPLRRWSVFAPDGVWVGDVEAPERKRIVDSRGDVVLGLWRDEVDVQYLRFHRLVDH